MVAPFLFFVAPRLVYSLHPEPVINTTGKVEMNPRMLAVLLVSAASFTALFYWMLSLARRSARLAEAQLEREPEGRDGRPGERER